MHKSALLALLAIVSCGKVKAPDGLYSIDSRVIQGAPAQVRLYDIAESVEIVRLETGEELHIGQTTAVAFADTLLLVYSSPPAFGSAEGGLFVFDSRTGDFKYKLPGFMDRGPTGYNRSPSPLVVDDNRILLNKWDTWGLWDFTTGEMLSGEVPLGPGIGSAHLLNDTSVIVDRLWVDPGAADKVEVVSTLDGSVIRGLGRVRSIDQTVDGNPDRSRMWEHGGDFSYYSMVCDTIYGIDRTTFAFRPRFVLNFGNKLFPDVKGGLFATGYLSVTSVCESDRYLFITCSEGFPSGIGHLVCYDKREDRTMYVGKMSPDESRAGFDDDLSPLSVRFFPQGVTSDDRVYSVVQAVDVVAGTGDERAAELGISEDDNPVIVIAKLRN
jgi:hypothetical protein